MPHSNNNIKYKTKIFSASILVSIFVIVLLSHFFSTNITSGDSAYSIHTAMSIIKECNIDLDEYEEIIQAKKNQFYCVKQLNGHYYFSYPLGASILSVPFVYLADKILPLLVSSFPSFEKYIRNRVDLPFGSIDPITAHSLVEVFIASILVALTALCIYFTAKNSLGVKSALLVTFIFAFCTAAWSTASRALWPHGPSMLMLAITLLIILRSRKTPYLIPLASIPLAFSYIIRPTNIVSIILFTLFIFLHYRRFFVFYFSGLVFILGIFFVFNYITYESMISPTYISQAVLPGRNFAEGLLGVLFSPSRGLFIFSPIFFFVLLGIFLKIKHHQFEILDRYVLGIIFFHWLMIGTFPRWWAGWSFGPRYFSDIIPYLIYFLFPVLRYQRMLKGIKRWAYNGLFYCFLIFSFFVHFRGAMRADVLYWNSLPVSIDLTLERLWEWKDIQFLRGLINEHSDFSYKAQIDAISFTDKEDLHFLIRVSNTGTFKWRRTTDEVLRIGCRIFDTQDDTASTVLELKKELPENVIGVGDSFETTFVIKKQYLDKGSYKIIFDMVRENKYWFETIGSRPLFYYFVIS